LKKSLNISSQGNSYSFLLLLLDLISINLSLFIAARIYQVILNKDYLIASLAVSLLFSYCSQMMKIYRPWRGSRFVQMIFTVWGCITVAFLGLLLSSFIFKQTEDFSRVTFSIWGVLTFFITFSWRVFYARWRKRRIESGRNIKNVAILGANKLGADLKEQIEKEKELGYRLLGFFDDRAPTRIEEETGLKIEGKIDDAVLIANAGLIQTLFIVLPLKAEKRIADILLLLGDTTVDVHIVPDFLLANLVYSRIDHIGTMDTLSVYESPYFGAKEWIKRTEDLVLATIILFLISIPMLLIGLLVKLTSRGPVLFKQSRYGLGGEEIKVWKFRSMKSDRKDTDDKVIQATKDDDRVTKVGAFLRRTSLDELPQFINVLTGGMSIVGPRPHAVSHNEEYRHQIDYYMLRHKVKPGITGWAQINGWRGETDTLEKMEKRIEFDLDYIRQWSLWFDVKIIFLTIFKGFLSKNAY